MEPIIRKTRKLSNPENEILVQVDHGDGAIRARRVTDASFPRWGTSYYSVRKKFVEPITIFGDTTRIYHAESDDSLELKPTVRVLGVTSDGATRAASVLHLHEKNQEVFLRNSISDLLKRYIEEEEDPIRAFFEPGSKEPWTFRLASDVRKRYGLDVKVQLLFEEGMEKWVDALCTGPPRRLTLNFRPFTAAREFHLIFSYRVVNVHYAFWTALRRRTPREFAAFSWDQNSVGGLDEQRVQELVDGEMSQIESRIKDILNPIISGFSPEILQCSHPGFWRMLGQAFNEAFDRQIGKEFGVRAELSDVMREKNKLEEELDKFEDEDALDSLERKRELLVDAEENLNKMMRTSGFDLESAEVQNAQRAVDAIRGQIKEMKTGINQEHQLEAVRVLPSEEMIPILEKTLATTRHHLALPEKNVKLALTEPTASSTPSDSGDPNFESIYESEPEPSEPE